MNNLMANMLNNTTNNNSNTDNKNNPLLNDLKNNDFDKSFDKSFNKSFDAIFSKILNKGNPEIVNESEELIIVENSIIHNTTLDLYLNNNKFNNNLPKTIKIQDTNISFIKNLNHIDFQNSKIKDLLENAINKDLNISSFNISEKTMHKSTQAPILKQDIATNDILLLSTKFKKDLTSSNTTTLTNTNTKEIESSNDSLDNKDLRTFDSKGFNNKNNTLNNNNTQNINNINLKQQNDVNENKNTLNNTISETTEAVKTSQTTKPIDINTNESNKILKNRKQSHNKHTESINKESSFENDNIDSIEDNTQVNKPKSSLLNNMFNKPQNNSVNTNQTSTTTQDSSSNSIDSQIIEFKYNDLENKKTFESKLVNEIANQTILTINKPQVTEIKLTLNPKSLGRIDIKLNEENGSLSLEIKVSNKGVENMLTHSLLTLKENIETNTSLNMNNINVFTQENKNVEHQNNLINRKFEQQDNQSNQNNQDNQSNKDNNENNDINIDEVDGELDFQTLRNEIASLH